MQGFLLVGGYGCDKEKYRGLTAKWRRPCAFDRGGAGSQPFITDRVAGAAMTQPWTALVDLVHGCTVHRSLKAKG
jgi:hypothetical protein